MKIYKAFISYRQVGDSVVLAEELHGLIEKCRLPKEYRGYSLKCFIDKKELPAGCDLPQEIKKGLDESEYLIVFCSKEGKRQPHPNVDSALKM